MAEPIKGPINLNKVRKDRAKAVTREQAAANRIIHGRTRAEKAKAETERLRADRLLDGSRRERPAED